MYVCMYVLNFISTNFISDQCEQATPVNYLGTFVHNISRVQKCKTIMHMVTKL